MSPPKHSVRDLSSSSRESPPTSARRDERLPLLTAAERLNTDRGVPDSGALLDIVQFSASSFYVEEHEEFLSIDIMRLGGMLGPCAVSYATEDDTAKAGDRYKASSGLIVFEDGEDMRTIEIGIINTTGWATTQEFTITLSDPKNCELGIYLQRARVKVIDNDVFPSSKYQADLMEGQAGIDRVGEVRLWLEFMGLITAARGVAWRMILVVLTDQIQNLYLFVQLNMMLYLVDEVLIIGDPGERRLAFEVLRIGDSGERRLEGKLEGEEESESELWFTSGPYGGRQYTAIAVGLIYAAPMCLMYLLELMKVGLDLEGLIDGFLKVNLFNKYVNYTEESRSHVSSQTMQEAMLRETQAVTEGYVASLKVLRFCGKLLVLLIFAGKECPAALPGLMVMPIIMGVAVKIAAFVYNKRVVLAESKLVDMVTVLQNVCSNFGLITEYQQTNRFFHKYKGKVEMVAEADMQVAYVKCHVDQIAKMLGPFFIAWHMIDKGDMVLSGSMSMGFFLASIRMFTEMSAEFAELYKEFMMMGKAMAILQRLTHFYNLETSLMSNKIINRERRRILKEERNRILKSTHPYDINGAGVPVDFEYRTDKIKLWVSGATFFYPGEDKPIISNVSVQFEQGSVIAITGGRGSGKALLMRLIGGIAYPSSGTVFVPSHLRVLYVPQNVVLPAVSIWDNLTLGNPYESPERVRSIVQALEMQETLTLLDAFLRRHTETNAAELEDDEESTLGVSEHKGRGIESLPHTEAAKLQLARALVMNPEVLIMQGPLSHFHDSICTEMLAVLHEHVRNRGYLLPEKEVLHRRPRSLLFSPTSWDQIENTTCVWELHGGEGIVVKHTSQLTATDYERWQLHAPPNLLQVKPGQASHWGVFDPKRSPRASQSSVGRDK